ncbi:MAG TPA: hypothetical protein VLN59_01400 [Burkholderiales bacterium]|nr:hypothetical protein [Burkholderiales bacterium]
MANELTQAPPRPTRCPHCGTVAAEYVCHTCKKQRNDPIHPLRRDPFCTSYLIRARISRRFA